MMLAHHGQLGGLKALPVPFGVNFKLVDVDGNGKISEAELALRAFSASSRKSISIQGRSLMSSNPKSRGPLAKIISRINSSYSMSRRPWVT